MPHHDFAAVRADDLLFVLVHVQVKCEAVARNYICLGQLAILQNLVAQVSCSRVGHNSELTHLTGHNLDINSNVTLVMTLNDTLYFSFTRWHCTLGDTTVKL